MKEGNNCEENGVITAKQQQNGMRSFGFATAAKDERCFGSLALRY
jgi:hypothetical protein